MVDKISGIIIKYVFKLNGSNHKILHSYKILSRYHTLLTPCMYIQGGKFYYLFLYKQVTNNLCICIIANTITINYTKLLIILIGVHILSAQFLQVWLKMF